MSQTTLEDWSPTVEELSQAFQDQPPIGDKDGDYFVRGPCSPGCTTRADANIPVADIIVLDGDCTIDMNTGRKIPGAPPPESIHQALVKRGITHELYTTHSHGFLDKGNRVRVLIPAKGMMQDQLAACVEWVIEQLHQADCPLADVPENHTWSQPWYLPRLAAVDSEYLHFSHRGEQKFDVAAAIAWKEAQSATSWTPKQLQGARKASPTRPPDKLIARFIAKYGEPQWMLSTLNRHGYTQKSYYSINGETAYRLLSPASASGNAGTVVFKGEDAAWRVYSHHGEADSLNQGHQGISSCDAWDLYRLLDYEGDEARAHSAAEQLLDERPLISIVAGQLDDNLNATVTALADLEPHTVYQRGQSLCRIAHLEETSKNHGCTIPKGTAHIVPYHRGMLSVELSRVIRWQKLKKGNWVTADPCPKVVGALLEAIGRWRGIPSLVGISETPILQSDGTLLSDSGFDKESRLYVEGRNPSIMLPERITREDALIAVKILLEPFSEFPLVERELDLACILAYLLTLVLRALLPAAPLICISATTPGTGKGLLVEICNLLVRGRDAAIMPPVQGSGSEEELRKRITAVLDQGLSSINMDNCTKAIGGEALNSLLTAEEWTDRRLGSSTTVTLPNRATIAATGNNMTARGDTTRRAIAIMLDAGVERPELRSFKEKDLPGRVLRDRQKLLTALFTILKGYQQAGYPGAQDKLLGRFEAWTSAVCGPIRWLGFQDPLLSQDRLREQDPETDKLETLLSAWFLRCGSTWTAVGKLIELSDVSSSSNSIIQKQSTTLHEALVEAAADGRGHINRNKLGWYLRHFTGRIAGGYRLEKKARTSDKSKNPQQYRVVHLQSQGGGV